MRAERRVLVLLGVTAGSVLGTIVLALAFDHRNAADDAVAGPVTILASAAVGALILRRCPGHGVGVVLLSGSALQSLSVFADRWAVQAAIVDPGSLPAARLAAWVNLLTAPAGAGLLVAGPVLLFPDGMPRTRWLRRFVVAVAAVATAALLAAAAIGLGAPATSLMDRPDVEATGRGAIAVALATVALLCAGAALVVGVVSLLVGAFRAHDDRRRQYTVVLAGAALAAAGVVVITASNAPEWTQSAAFVVLPLSLGAAIVRYRLYDIEVIVARAVVLLGVAAVCLGVYLAAVAITVWLTDSSSGLDGPSLVAAVAVVAILAPLARLAEFGLRHWLYGSRGRPDRVGARLGAQAAGDPAGPDPLADLIATVARELRLGGLSLELADGTMVAVGAPGGPNAEVIELASGGRPVGTVVASPRRNERFTVPEVGALRETAAVLGIAVAAVLSSQELSAARARELAAHQEERRRVRSDLHDGLGPMLAAVRMGLAAAARDTPDVAEGERLAHLRDRTADAIREVRRLVDGLSPSLVEDLGLAAALRVLVDDLSGWGAGTAPLIELEIDGAEPVPAWAAVPVYRIVSEGLSNVVRHARAARCRVQVRMDGDIEVLVHDDGVGFDPQAAAGMGLRSIRERAAALGGTVTVRSRPGGGTAIEVRIPVAATLPDAG
jgi:signal transduction histidine kinase